MLVAIRLPDGTAELEPDLWHVAFYGEKHVAILNPASPGVWLRSICGGTRRPGIDCPVAPVCPNSTRRFAILGEKLVFLFLGA